VLGRFSLVALVLWCAGLLLQLTQHAHAGRFLTIAGTACLLGGLAVAPLLHPKPLSER